MQFCCLLTFIVRRFSIFFGVIFSEILSRYLFEAVPWSNLLFCPVLGGHTCADGLGQICIGADLFCSEQFMQVVFFFLIFIMAYVL